MKNRGNLSQLERTPPKTLGWQGQSIWSEQLKLLIVVRISDIEKSRFWASTVPHLEKSTK